MAVVGKAMERATALKLAAQTQPDVVLLDLDLAGELSLDFLPELLRLSSARVLVFTGINDPGLHARALQDGACGVVRKEENADVLLRAITRAHQSRAVARIGESARALDGGGAAGL